MTNRMNKKGLLGLMAILLAAIAVFGTVLYMQLRPVPDIPEIIKLQKYNEERTPYLLNLISNQSIGLKAYNETDYYNQKLAFYEYAIKKENEEDMADFLDYFEDHIKDNIDKSKDFELYYYNLLGHEKDFLISLEPKTDEQLEIIERYWLLVLIEIDFNLEAGRFSREVLGIELEAPGVLTYCSNNICEEGETLTTCFEDCCIEEQCFLDLETPEAGVQTRIVQAMLQIIDILT